MNKNFIEVHISWQSDGIDLDNFSKMISCLDSSFSELNSVINIENKQQNNFETKTKIVNVTGGSIILTIVTMASGLITIGGFIAKIASGFMKKFGGKKKNKSNILLNNNLDDEIEIKIGDVIITIKKSNNSVRRT